MKKTAKRPAVEIIDGGYKISKSEPEEFPYIPLGDNVLLDRLEAEAPKLEAGVVIPENAKPKSDRCVVVALSRKAAEMQELEIGDYVVVTKHGTENILLDGKDYALAHYSEIKVKRRR